VAEDDHLVVTGEDGAGVSATDFLLYVSAHDTVRCNVGATVAYAAYCQLEAGRDRCVVKVGVSVIAIAIDVAIVVAIIIVSVIVIYCQIKAIGLSGLAHRRSFGPILSAPLTDLNLLLSVLFSDPQPSGLEY
jgi:hypothetical protein